MDLRQKCLKSQIKGVKMKRLLIFTVVGLLLAGSCMAEINILFGRIPIPLPDQTQVKILTNFQIIPYWDFSLQQQNWGFTSEWIRQWDILYSKWGYTSSNQWLLLGGADLLSAFRKLGCVVNFSAEDIIQKVGVKKITLDFLITYGNQGWTAGIGTTIFDVEKP